MSVALLPGRFQPFHRGHVAIAQTVVTDGHELIVMIGSAQEEVTWENPFSASERREMVSAGLTAANLETKAIVAIGDVNDNSRWVSHTIAQLPPFDYVYSANSLVQRLFREADYSVSTVELQNRQVWEGAAIRQALAADEAWETALQPEIVALVRRFGGPERLRKLAPK
ncbi:MAG: nicotinamide-nucleotide adenylyltransferase [Candidatus Poseidoniia archaeon]|jgi:nicotinamide-nucleotide adenylyltransferase|nr:nicotinate-nucleotide adenylyltransferase [Euryarchaeota archaeon]MDP6489236.1 nicotinamide-nucleotide adenylyltransferase [Candidatus Poseidoniia archaeon]MDP6534596.1 nicotinamide-nucleotide adenylyltransferase [Candidatus Poseidoniia archaeon]MDP6834934.1 nicotinamide-nucleotide adenylyltransferase [Candidatus Poseidoniia archaeon]HIH79530.1 nicotinamide-nucleotide adenylyltransferase [Candidatus Poseidoniia archaeon]|tara:strand:+ start:647 stop:1153 length:507 start_codon:yes stop_codon:yes gene_type:complete